MSHIQESDKIAGVHITNLKAFGDSRGTFREIFRREWFPQREWTNLQSNCVHSAPNVLRGLHYHFNQVDYWYIPVGRIRAALFDMRPNSPTYMATQTVDMGEENDIGLYIPIGVAHGFAALTAVRMIYFVDNYYNSTDEFGVAWNDPALGIDWGVNNPILSERDMTNPVYADVSAENHPK